MKTWKLIMFIMFLLVMASIIFMGYFCSDIDCALTKSRDRSAIFNSPVVRSYVKGELTKNAFKPYDIDREYSIDLEDEDVIVFLHIQKTGGTTFGRHLVRNLDIDSPCTCNLKKRCDCLTRRKTVWLFSRYSTGWLCGLHADWTELKNCVDGAMDKKEKTHRNRRYYYITILRDPVQRYISEWMHVRRGATWKTSHLKCNGRSPSLDELPFCFQGPDWKGVSLAEFLQCPHNLASNRQTRMLANLSKVNCYNTTGISSAEREEMLLDSAKENLINLAFFGLTEFQNYTQFLFENTFGIHFIEDFQQFNMTHSSQSSVPEDQYLKIIERNSLDIRLYQFAKDLFFQRVQKMLEEAKTLPQKVDSFGGPDKYYDEYDDSTETKRGNVNVYDMREESSSDKFKIKTFN